MRARLWESHPRAGLSVFAPRLTRRSAPAGNQSPAVAHALIVSAKREA